MIPGFIGLGQMGGPLAGRIAQKFRLLVWDRTPSVMEGHTNAHGSVAAPSLEALCSQADAIFLSLPTSAVVEAVVNEMVPNLRAGTVIVDCTSGEPEAAQRIASVLKGPGCAYVGGPRGAAAGTVAAMAGGPEEALGKVRPFVDCFAKKVVHLGTHGSGFATKSVNNTINMGTFLLTVEGLLSLKARGGLQIDPLKALSVLNASSSRSLQSEVRVPEEVVSRRFGYGFKLGLMKKDVGIGSRFGQGPLFSAVRALIDKAEAAQGEGADYTEAAKYLEAEFGMDLSSAFPDLHAASQQPNGTAPAPHANGSVLKKSKAESSSQQKGKEGERDPRIVQSFVLPQGVDLLVCDMAGTTVSEEGAVYVALRRSVNAVLEEEKLAGGGDFKPVEEAELDEWHGAQKDIAMRVLLEQRMGNMDGGGKLDEAVKRAETFFVNELEEAYFGPSSKVAPIKPNLVEWLRELRSQPSNVKVAFNTGYPPRLQNGLIEKLNLGGKIDARMSASDPSFGAKGAGRPSPLMIFRLMERLEIESTRKVIKIGDSARDIEEGRNAGCLLSLGVLSGADSAEKLLQAGADLVLPDVTCIRPASVSGSS